MNQAMRVTMATALVCLVPLYLAVANGSLLTAGLAALGLALFLLGTTLGHSGLVVGGLGGLVFGAALGLGGVGTDGASASGDLATMSLLGVVAVVALVLADASWWSRRDAEVEPRVVTGLVVTIASACAVGVGTAAVAQWIADRAAWPNWLLPAAFALLGLAVLLVGEIARRRRLQWSGAAS